MPPHAWLLTNIIILSHSFFMAYSVGRLRWPRWEGARVDSVRRWLAIAIRIIWNHEGLFEFLLGWSQARERALRCHHEEVQNITWCLLISCSYGGFPFMRVERCLHNTHSGDQAARPQGLFYILYIFDYIWFWIWVALLIENILLFIHQPRELIIN